MQPPCTFLVQIEIGVDVPYTFPPKLGGMGSRASRARVSSPLSTGGTTPAYPCVFLQLRPLPYLLAGAGR